MQQAGGVWIGVAWWAAGPWWDTVRDSIQSLGLSNDVTISVLPIH